MSSRREFDHDWILTQQVRLSSNMQSEHCEGATLRTFQVLPGERDSCAGDQSTVGLSLIDESFNDCALKVRRVQVFFVASKQALAEFESLGIRRFPGRGRAAGCEKSEAT
jgi:hypothetical protein